MNASDMALLALLFAIGTGIYWMAVGWRAMRAHERLADASEQAVRKLFEPK